MLPDFLIVGLIPILALSLNREIPHQIVLTLLTIQVFKRAFYEFIAWRAFWLQWWIFLKHLLSKINAIVFQSKFCKLALNLDRQLFHSDTARGDKGTRYWDGSFQLNACVEYVSLAYRCQIVGHWEYTPQSQSCFCLYQLGKSKARR